jgi:tRNA G18 (ribose-2'-O)-methylase SpoU
MYGGSPLWTIDMNKPVALIVSNEANGATRQAMEWVKDRIQIPMPGKTESLNVSVAAGILLFEAVRQREKL